MTKAVLAAREQRFGGDHLAVAASLHNAGSSYLALRRYDDALACFRRELSIVEKQLGPDHPSVGNALSHVGRTETRLGRWDDAMRDLERARAILDKSWGPDHPLTLSARRQLGLVQLELGRPAQALAEFEGALAAAEKRLGPDHRSLADHHRSAAQALLDLGRLDEALDHARRAAAICEKNLGSDHVATAAAIGTVGEIMAAKGDAAGGGERMGRALDILDRSLTAPEGVSELRFALGTGPVAARARPSARAGAGAPRPRRSRPVQVTRRDRGVVARPRGLAQRGALLLDVRPVGRRRPPQGLVEQPRRVGPPPLGRAEPRQRPEDVGVLAVGQLLGPRQRRPD